ncbi:hypothetical protein [Croceimicrobium sp.]|uniref:hypothetical protein n=1 Tax=Croceimicrobium sp. TaxID=2828340 RepID=UPI003BAB0FC8
MLKYKLILAGLSISLAGYAYLSSHHSDTEPKIIAKNQANTNANSHVQADLFFQKNEGFFFDLDTRFRPIKRSELLKAKQFSDFADAEDIRKVHHYQSLELAAVISEQLAEDRLIAKGPELSAEQLAWLENAPYSTNFRLRADFLEALTVDTNNLSYNYSTPHLTLVPESQAYYKDGKRAFIQYIREGALPITSTLNEEDLFAAKIYFTIGVDGVITKAKVGTSCKSAELDAKMLDLLANLPGEWEVARDINGQAVEQELVLSYALPGC